MQMLRCFPSSLSSSLARRLIFHQQQLGRSCHSISSLRWTTQHHHDLHNSQSSCYDGKAILQNELPLQLMQQRRQSTRPHNHHDQKRPRHLTISQASHLLTTHQITPQQLCTHYYNLAYFGETSLKLNAYVKLLSLDEILYQAQQSHDRIYDGNKRKSVLDGIPITVKANIAVGKWWMMPNSSSNILNTVDNNNSNNSPNNECNNSDNSNDDVETAVYTSDIAHQLLNECGAILIGITNMDEFGMGSLGLNSGLLLPNDDDNSSTKKPRPIYNPLPYMERLSMMQSSQEDHHIDNDDHDDDDRYWIEQIQNSTIQNPHGIKNQVALDELLDEVRYWTSSDVPLPSSLEEQQQHYSSSPLLSSGGSSSGAATTIAHGSSLLSIGTDTGGSLRLPAAWTSTVGFKPTYGSISRYGVVSYASSLDTVGFVTGSVECARLSWECLMNRDGNDGDDGDDAKIEEVQDDESKNDYDRSCFDATKSRDATARVYHDTRFGCVSTNIGSRNEDDEDTKKPLTNLRIGIPNAFSLHETPPLISNAWSDAANTLQNVGGATLIAIPESVLSSEWIKLSCAAYYVLACAEASSNLSRYDGVRFGLDIDMDKFTNLDNVQGYEEYHPLSGMTALEEKIAITRVLGFGDEVQRRLLAGTSVLSSDRFHTHYEAAAIVRAKVSQSIERAFRSSSTAVIGKDDIDDNDNNKVDAMLVPTALSFPCTLNPKLEGDRIIEEDMDATAAFGNDVMTIPISLGGFPSISVPFSPDNTNNANSNPDQRAKDVVGLQVFGMRGSEDIVLQVANILNTSSS
jgi:aspartyl-tRNA(Asn)/glutamyl-tRNA(Gln) amidotransferase subunit A